MPDGVLEHLTDSARLQVTELVPHELGAVFVVSPVEKDNVQMWIEPQVAGRALHDGHRAALGCAERASAHGALFVQPLHALDEETRHRAEERAILG
ncbi:hypothetical protein [Sorangium sp. So ce1504]|uniref:hypothetical protein n=1 Tax=unclassified Sorangium TaxID=2621164 RepID=UPI003F5E5F52